MQQVSLLYKNLIFLFVVFFQTSQRESYSAIVVNLLAVIALISLVAFYTRSYFKSSLAKNGLKKPNYTQFKRQKLSKLIDDTMKRLNKDNENAVQ